MKLITTIVRPERLPPSATARRTIRITTPTTIRIGVAAPAFFSGVAGAGGRAAIAFRGVSAEIGEAIGARTEE